MQYKMNSGNAITKNQLVEEEGETESDTQVAFSVMLRVLQDIL